MLQHKRVHVATSDHAEVSVDHSEVDVEAAYGALVERLAQDLSIFRGEHRPHEAVTGSIVLDEKGSRLSIESPDDETVHISRSGNDDDAFIITFQISEGGFVSRAGQEPQEIRPGSNGMWHLSGMLHVLQEAARSQET